MVETSNDHKPAFLRRASRLFFLCGADSGLMGWLNLVRLAPLSDFESVQLVSHLATANHALVSMS